MPLDWSNHYPRLTIVEQPPEPLCSLWHTSGDTPNVEMLEIAEPPGTDIGDPMQVA